jgi:hypothetical protein
MANQLLVILLFCFTNFLLVPWQFLERGNKVGLAQHDSSIQQLQTEPK